MAWHKNFEDVVLKKLKKKSIIKLNNENRDGIFKSFLTDTEEFLNKN